MDSGTPSGMLHYAHLNACTKSDALVQKYTIKKKVDISHYTTALLLQLLKWAWLSLSKWTYSEGKRSITGVAFGKHRREFHCSVVTMCVL